MIGERVRRRRRGSECIAALYVYRKRPVQYPHAQEILRQIPYLAGEAVAEGLAHRAVQGRDEDDPSHE